MRYEEYVKIEMEGLTVSLDAIENMSCIDYQWVFDNSHRISMEYKDIIMYFFTFNNTNMFNSFIVPEWRNADNNFRYRFMLIQVDDDIVIFFLKAVDNFVKQRYYYLQFEPLSYSGNVEPIIRTLKAFKDSSIHFLLYSSDENKDSKANNFYNLKSDFYDWMNKAKWKGKRGVNKLNKILSVKVGKENGFDLETKISCLRDLWEIEKSSSKEKVYFHKSDSILVDMYEKSDDIVPITLWFKESLVGFAILYLFQNRALVFSCKTISVLGKEKIKEYIGDIQDEDLMDLSRYLGGYIQYVIHGVAFGTLEVDELYYDGDSNMRGLANYKNIYFKHVLYYNKCSLEDYINKLREV